MATVTSIDQTTLRAQIIEAETKRLQVEADNKLKDLQQQILGLNSKVQTDINDLVAKIDTLINNEQPEFALYDACIEKKWQDCEILLKLNLVKNSYPPASNKSQPLILATDANQIELVKLLINAGSDLNSVDCYGNTALSIAARNNYLEIAKILIDAGANVNSKNMHNNPIIRRCFLYSPYSLDIFEILVNAGANLYCTDENKILLLDTMRGLDIDKKYIDMVEKVYKERIEKEEAEKRQQEALKIQQEALKIHQETLKIQQEAQQALKIKQEKIANREKMAQENIELKKLIEESSQKHSTEISNLQQQLANLEAEKMSLHARIQQALVCIDETGNVYPMLD